MCCCRTLIQGQVKSKPGTALGRRVLSKSFTFYWARTAEKASLFRSDELVNHSFFGEFSFGTDNVSVERTGSRPSRIYLVGTFEGRSELPIRIEKGNNREYLSNVNWKAFLGHLWFGLPLDLSSSIFGKPYTPSFRSMISYFVRRHQSRAFISPERQAERQQPWDWQENLSYLFGLDWRLPYELQKIRVREKALEELRRAAKDGAFGEIIGTVAELRSEVAVAEKKATDRRVQLEDFRVLDSYDDLSRSAAKAKGEMQSLARESVIIRETLDHLEHALASEQPPDSADLKALFQAARVELPGVALRRFTEVKAFYDSVVENRRIHLTHEIDELKERLSEIAAESGRLDNERHTMLKILECHGALDDFIALQKKLSELEAVAATLRERFKAAEILEGEKMQLEIDRVNLHQRLQQDHQDRKLVLDEAILVVTELISELYDDRSGRFEIGATDKGPECRISIEGDRGGGIANMEIFCLDMALMIIGRKSGLCPNFLIHDSHLFDGVDERQISRALELGFRVTGGERSAVYCYNEFGRF